MVYHGTNAGFNKFDLSKGVSNGRALGDGFYFAIDKSVPQQSISPLYFLLV
ncbi:hypothetical protein [Porphyromonas loveana]|uniref:hypothetical protein n=1 Tax=Porphyromonas loveana TaxID=1884669 RepID=UPI0035A1CAC5